MVCSLSRTRLSWLSFQKELEEAITTQRKPSWLRRCWSICLLVAVPKLRWWRNQLLHHEGEALNMKSFVRLLWSSCQDAFEAANRSGSIKDPVHIWAATAVVCWVGDPPMNTFHVRMVVFKTGIVKRVAAVWRDYRSGHLFVLILRNDRDTDESVRNCPQNGFSGLQAAKELWRYYLIVPAETKGSG